MSFYRERILPHLIQMSMNQAHFEPVHSASRPQHGIGGGCHLNRQIDQLIRDGGFVIEQIQTGYMKGPKPMTFVFEGVARKL